jgi:hypothetical protein
VVNVARATVGDANELRVEDAHRYRQCKSIDGHTRISISPLFLLR